MVEVPLVHCLAVDVVRMEVGTHCIQIVKGCKCHIIEESNLLESESRTILGVTHNSHHDCFSISKPASGTMDSPKKPTGSFDLETTVRLLLILNNAIALGLSFACLKPVFFVLGAILSVSFLFNIFVLLPKLKSKRPKLGREDPKNHCPSLLVLATDILGVIVFLSVYIWSTLYIVGRDVPYRSWNWIWGPTLVMT